MSSRLFRLRIRGGSRQSIQLPPAAAPREVGPLGEERRAIVIGIETSCDDTCVAVLSAPVVCGRVQLAGTAVLAHAAASQHALHAAAGGVVPHFAARAHVEQLPRVHAAAVALAERRLGGGRSLPPPAAIAVTCGPGLAGCLKAGLVFARALAVARGAARPLSPPPLLLPVHHLEAHLLVPRLCSSSSNLPLPFPYLVLLVSGGHTALVLARGPADYATLATTLDDSLGEAFDKVARGLQVWRHPPRPVAAAAAAAPPRAQTAWSGPELHLSEGGSGAGGAGHLGAQLEALAREGDERAFPLSVPLRNTRGALPCAFSFSGLKSAMHRLLLTAPARSSGEAGSIDLASRAAVAGAAASFQRCVAGHLVDQLSRAVDYCALQAALGLGPPVDTLVVCGGVASNAYLRDVLTASAPGIGLARVVFPPAPYCVDNGVMVAWAGLELLAAVEGLGGGGAHPTADRPARRGLSFPWAALGETEAVALDFDAGWALGDPPPTRTRVD